MLDGDGLLHPYFFLCCFRNKDAIDFIEDRSQHFDILIKLALTALDTRHVKHMIDDREEETPRLRDLSLIVDELRIGQFLPHELVIAKDGIHRGADMELLIQILCLPSCRSGSMLRFSGLLQEQDENG